MPINVFGNSNSNNKGNKTDTSLSVQKPYLRTNYLESIIEGDMDLKNQYKIKSLPEPVSIKEAAAKNYIDKSFIDPSIIKNTGLVDFFDKNLKKISLLK